jgi:UDP-sugar transporter A1/2/3
VAVTLKYADNILKGFATSISIILTALLSYFWLGDLDINYKFVIGTGLVLWSTFEYGRPSKEAPGVSILQPGGGKHTSAA